jgi:selenide,water dikinase
LVGPETADDAGVYRIGAELALVETADIITPLVDDPFTFGRIAAANALSDVYAMGGRPLTAMNLVFFPACTLPIDILKDILSGGAAMLNDAGVCLVGGHTVEDDELKYGLAVTGIVHPDKIVRNSTARPGDLLILTKPLGAGIIATAVKAEMAPADVAAEAVRWMTMLNAVAAGIMLECEAHACTDVTGFGLIGHACEMARGAGVTIRLELDRVPVMSGVAALVNNGLVPAGCYRNRDYYSEFVARGEEMRSADCGMRNEESKAMVSHSALRTPHSFVDDELLPLFDPQTSGGLLVALLPQSAERFLQLAAEKNCFAVRIGEVVGRRERPIEFS